MVSCDEIGTTRRVGEKQLASSHEREIVADIRIQETQEMQERLDQMADEELRRA